MAPESPPEVSVAPVTAGAGSGAPPEPAVAGAAAPEPGPNDLDAIIEAKRARRQQEEESNLDPFDPERLRLSQDFASAVGVRKLLTTVPVRKPSKEWFVRTHPDPAYRLETAVLELKEDREVYLVAPELREDLATEPTFSRRELVLAVNRQGIVFLWPLRLPNLDGRLDEWSRSALDASVLAKEQWVRLSANMSLQAYDATVAPAQLAEPAWPDLPLKEILRIGFRDRMISDRNHPVLRRLRGEV
jgi:hypothetical protein